MLIRTARTVSEAEATPETLYLNRRQLLGWGAGAAAFGLFGASGVAAAATVTDPPTPWEAATSYNNFYEYGSSKSDPARLAPAKPPVAPWMVRVEGACAKPGVIGLEDLIRPAELIEPVYRMRCVEGWSMVIPWRGVALGPVLARFEPTAAAKFVAFTTLSAPEHFPGQRRRTLDWPYVEGLRLDEAMHPLTLLATGMYGRDLPMQNGAPLRLVVPWKYGFKSIKSIVAIRFVETQPVSAWMKISPDEYGFYANVNPAVDHPRWSQSTERRIGEFRRRPTLPFNGYAEDVAGLYQGMDLARMF